MTAQLPEPMDRMLRGCTLHPVTVGRSGAAVYRVDAAGAARSFLKCAPASIDADSGSSLRHEADVLAWLSPRGVPVPEVEVFLEADGMAYLLTRALPGRDASSTCTAADVPRIVEALGAGLARVHALAIDGCPFDCRLDVKLERARLRVEAGLVDIDDFDDARRGRSAEDVLAEVVARRPAREDLVFCHGDYCLPNVVIARDPLGIAGFVDVARAGVADRAQDLALMTRSLESPENPSFNGSSRLFLASYGAGETDLDGLDYYRLLDELF